MNHTKNILAGFTLLVMLGLASCLKDSPGLSDPAAGTNNVVEFQNSNIPVSYTSIYPQYDNGLILAPDTAGFNVNIDYTGAIASAPQDITVTLALSQAALTAFNADQGTSYIIPPTDVFTIPTSVIIPKGSRNVQVRAIIKGAADFDFTKNYALPLTITGASSGVVSTNFGTAIYSFIVKNKYDGNYTSTGYLFHPSSPRAIAATYSVTTVNPTTCRFPFGDLGGSGYLFTATIPASGGALTNFTPGSGMPQGGGSGFMTADNPGSTNFSTAAPNAPGTAPWLSSTYNNSYDATGKIFWIHAGYVAAGGAGQTTWTRQVYEKMVMQ